MRADALRAALVALALAAGACGAGCSHLRSVAEPRRGTLHADDALVRAAILRALGGRRFAVEADNPGAVVATYEDARTWLRIEVTYDAGGYAIAYRESMGLEETVGDDGETRVDARYQALIGSLASDIERVITLPDTRAFAATAPPGATSAPPVPAAAAPSVAVAPAAGSTGAPPRAAGAPPPSGTYAAPATAGYATSTVPTTGYVGATGGGYAPPGPATPPRPTRSLHEVLVPGLVLWLGSWAVNWSITLGISRDPDMIGLSFLPIVGPFVELGFLEWSLYERWTGLWYPVAGLLQIVGLVMTVVGASVHVPDGEAPATASGFGRTWILMPSAGPESASLTFAATF